MNRHADVLVVGAGSSGIPAAIAAARAGARVVVVEEDALPGGAPVDSYVTFLCGGPRVGIFREMAETLNQKHNITGKPIPDFDAGSSGDGHWYTPPAYTDVLLSMLTAEPNIELILGAPVTHVLVEDMGTRNRIKGVRIERPSLESVTIEAAVTIDATGTGLIAVLAGCESRYGRDASSDYGENNAPEQADNKTMPCTWMYMSQRVRPGKVPPLCELSCMSFVEPNVGFADQHPEAYEANQTGAYLHWGATVDCEDTRDPICLAAAQQEAFGKLKHDMDVFEAHGMLVHLAPRIGVRESRRIVGEATITETDLVSGNQPDDVIAQAHYFLDLWGENLIKQHVNIEAGLPYGSLVPKGAEGLLVVGKAISGTHVAMSAYRVQPILASVGQAAGIAAAMAAQTQTGMRDIEINKLQSQLRRDGVLPQ